jgi:Na+/H+ antiporter NhaC
VPIAAAVAVTAFAPASLEWSQRLLLGATTGLGLAIVFALCAGLCHGVALVAGLIVAGFVGGWDPLHWRADGSPFGLVASIGVAAFVGLVVAALFVGELRPGLTRTARGIGPAILVLALGWTLSESTRQLGAGDYLHGLLGDAIAPELVPCILFALAAAIALATSSAWSASAVLLPLAVALCFALGERFPELGGRGLVVVGLAGALEGALFGAQCSPFSRGAVFAASAAGCDLAQHVRTQLGYVLLAMALALGVGYFPCTFLGWSPALSLAVGAGALLMIIFTFGRKSAAPAAH